MITAQNIREKTFEKSKYGGYDMPEVDDFLEEIAEDITATQKENAVLKSKMKVLVDKIEEYRANESAINASVLSAQKMAIQIENEAKARASELIAEADAKAKARLGSLDDEVVFEQQRLADAKAASAKFFDGMRAMCNAQLRNIDNLSAAVLPVEEAAEPEAVPAAEPAPQVTFTMPAADPEAPQFDNTQTFSF